MVSYLNCSNPIWWDNCESQDFSGEFAQESVMNRCRHSPRKYENVISVLHVLQALKRRNCELQMQLRALIAEEDKSRASRSESASEGCVFGLAHIRDKIEAAVQEAAALPDS
jgi:hypothetical protein